MGNYTIGHFIIEVETTIVKLFVPGTLLHNVRIQSNNGVIAFLVV